MLVLSRKKNEGIQINDDITIVIVQIRGDKVRLGVDVPAGLLLHRREIYDAILRNESHAPHTPRQTATILLSEEAAKAASEACGGKNLSDFVSSLVLEQLKQG